ncbi:protein of unknown function [Candidatus Filomicrobium marinum]|uniref:Uncharacterized protein n=1 Tax=Candidatus Filomicrobium marinum TaxID=1608628 RepID=A0A0D6JCR9_9HYPH|nr:protein of unknown function [Candidatus Filomicrobium marinum]
MPFKSAYIGRKPPGPQAATSGAISTATAITLKTDRLLHIRLDSPILSATEPDARSASGNDINDPLRHNYNLLHRLAF